MEERITELESRVAFQDDTIQALNDVLVAPQRALERLQLQRAALAKRQQESCNQFDMEQDEAPPPHY